MEEDNSITFFEPALSCFLTSLLLVAVEVSPAVRQKAVLPGLYLECWFPAYYFFVRVYSKV